MKANFSNSLLQHYSHFFVADKLYPLIPQRYLPEFSFQIGITMFFFISNDIPPLSFLNPSCILSPPFFPSSKIFSSKLYLFRLDSAKSSSSELDSDRKSSCLSQKSSFSLYILKNLLLC